MIDEIISFHEKNGFFSQTIPAENRKKTDAFECEIELTEENLCITPKKGTPRSLKMNMIVSVSPRTELDYNYTELLLREEKIYVFFGSKKKYDLKKNLYFFKALKKWMLLPKKLFSLGIKETKVGNFKGAINLFERALKLSPKYVDVLNAKGKAHENLGEVKNAILCYEAAYKIEPTNKRYLMNLDRIKAEIQKGGDKYQGLEKELEALRCPNCRGPIDKVPTPGTSIECVWCGFKITRKDS